MYEPLPVGTKRQCESAALSSAFWVSCAPWVAEGTASCWWLVRLITL